LKISPPPKARGNGRQAADNPCHVTKELPGNMARPWRHGEDIGLLLQFHVKPIPDAAAQ
jgi:hypothetical protein